MSAALRVALVFGGILVAISQQSWSDGKRLPRIEIPPLAGNGPKHPITLEDILSFREVHEPQVSPDGQHVAFLVKQAFRSCNCYRTALYVVDVQGKSSPQKLLEEDSLSAIRWVPGGENISYLSSRSGSVQLWVINVSSTTTKQVFSHAANAEQNFLRFAADPTGSTAIGILQYEWSHDGRSVAFTARPIRESEDQQSGGLVYDDTSMSLPDLVLGKLSHPPAIQLWRFRLADQRATLLWESPSSGVSQVQSIAWAPDDSRIAFSYVAWHKGEHTPPQGIGIIDVNAQESILIPNPKEAILTYLTWTTDGDSLGILSSSGSNLTWIEFLNARSGLREARIAELSGVAGGGGNFVGWNNNERELLVLADGVGERREKTGLYAISHANGAVRRITGQAEKLSECSGLVNEKLACVWQTPNTPPAPALVDIRTGKINPLANVNPEVHSIILGEVQELRWINKYGDETTGYLLTPPDFKPGSKRLPLVVIVRGFNGEFVLQANHHLTSYPAQAFARDGIAVILFNEPRWRDWLGPSFEHGAMAWGYSPLASLEAIVQRLVDDGIVDPDRVGIMGQSWGGFLVQFAITQSTLFRAAETLNGGSIVQPGTYWIGGNKTIRQQQEHVMGGPPYGPTLANYLAFSPALNADKCRTPLLIEASGFEAITALEMYTSLRRNSRPVEFVVYPRDGHNLVQPEHRFQSMQRNLDWFRFWLQGYEDPDTRRAAQYERWRSLRELTQPRGK